MASSPQPVSSPPLNGSTAALLVEESERSRRLLVEESERSRRSTAKEQWRSLLTAFLEHQQEQQDMLDDIAKDVGTIVSVGTTGDTVADGETAVEIDELHEDLDRTADNLADLEIEFAQDLDALAQGLDTAFDRWSAVGGSMVEPDLTASLIGMGTGNMDIPDQLVLLNNLGDSARDAWEISSRGVSSRGIPSGRRRQSMEFIKANMEMTFRETLMTRRQQASRRSLMASNADIITEGPAENNHHQSTNTLQVSFSSPKEEGSEEEDEKEFQNWFQKVWIAIEGFVARRAEKRRQSRLSVVAAPSTRKSGGYRSFWSLFHDT